MCLFDSVQNANTCIFHICFLISYYFGFFEFFFWRQIINDFEFFGYFDRSGPADMIQRSSMNNAFGSSTVQSKTEGMLSHPSLSFQSNHFSFVFLN
jgi:hypothetical protein